MIVLAKRSFSKNKSTCTSGNEANYFDHANKICLKRNLLTSARGHDVFSTGCAREIFVRIREFYN